jgi:hypothetical protein
MYDKEVGVKNFFASPSPFVIASLGGFCLLPRHYFRCSYSPFLCLSELWQATGKSYRPNAIFCQIG